MRRSVATKKERDASWIPFARADPAIQTTPTTHIALGVMRTRGRRTPEAIGHLESTPSFIAFLGTPDIEVLALDGLARIDGFREPVPLPEDDPEYRRPEGLDDERQRRVIWKGKVAEETFLGHELCPESIHRKPPVLSWERSTRKVAPKYRIVQDPL